MVGLLFRIGCAMFVCVFLAVSLVLYFEETAIATRQVSTDRAAPSETSAVAENGKEGCGCCAERRARLRKKIQEARERRRAAQHTQTPLVSQQNP